MLILSIFAFVNLQNSVRLPNSTETSPAEIGPMLGVEGLAGETEPRALDRRQRLGQGRQFALVLHSHIRVAVRPEGELILGYGRN